jgi:hypothetical protein
MHAERYFWAIILSLLFLPLAGSALALPVAHPPSYEGMWGNVDPGLHETILGTWEHSKTLLLDTALTLFPGEGDEQLLSRASENRKWNRPWGGSKPVAPFQSLAALRASLAETVLDPAAGKGPTRRAKGTGPSFLFLTGLLMILVARLTAKPRWPLAKRVSPVNLYRPSLHVLKK